MKLRIILALVLKDSSNFILQPVSLSKLSFSLIAYYHYSTKTLVYVFLDLETLSKELSLKTGQFKLFKEQLI